MLLGVVGFLFLHIGVLRWLGIGLFNARGILFFHPSHFLLLCAIVFLPRLGLAIFDSVYHPR